MRNTLFAGFAAAALFSVTQLPATRGIVTADAAQAPQLLLAAAAFSVEQTDLPTGLTEQNGQPAHQDTYTQGQHQHDRNTAQRQSADHA